MSEILLFLFLSSFFIPYQTQNLQPVNHEEAFISIRLSQNGVDFLKSMLMTKVLESITPLILPKIEHKVNIPLLGDADVLLSHIVITQISVYSSSSNNSGDSAGLQLIAWGEVCNLTISCHLPFRHRIDDNGCAAIQVTGMQLGKRLDLENNDGILKLSLLGLDYNDNDISVELSEGSLIFQRTIYSFQKHIGVSAQSAISKKFRKQILKLNSFLQDVPKEIPIDEISSLNVTFLRSKPPYIFDINGLFISRNRIPVPFPFRSFRNSRPSVSCTERSKMIEISIHEDVLNSASTLYYDAKFMRWIVDKLPDDTLLNTDAVPQLQKPYPKHEMKLNISLTSPPIIRISEHKLIARVNAELVINVLKADKFVPVVCFSLKIEASGLVKIMEDEDEYPGILRVGGSMKLKNLGASLKWSTIGNLSLHLIQPAVETLVEVVVLPYANAQLRQGFVVPDIHGFRLWKTEIILSNSRITVCGDLTYMELQ
ncbi:lipid-binding serum glycoprotein family protein [Euphorbia peplus]|nr:lipid-binding serum glycoprotein family protein [Euphorbia peplus]